MGRFRSILIALLAVALVPLTASVATADDVAPEITSFHRTSVDLLGAEELGSEALALVEFSAVDEGPAGLTYAMFTYATPLGAEIRLDSPWMNRAADGTYTASKVMSLWAASGSYTLQKAEVLDLEGNRTTYERATSPQFDWAAADFRVDNPLEDTTAPTVSFGEPFQREVAQGTPVVVLYGADDDLSGVEQVTFIARTPTGNQVNIQSLPGLGAAGPATWLVPLASPAGLYDVTHIFVFDRAGNYVTYDAAGEAYVYPPGATLPEHAHPDPNEADFTVAGTVGDRDAPQMTSFSTLTPPTRRLGDQVAIDYRAVDAGTGIAQVAARWSDGNGHWFEATNNCGDLTSGPLTKVIEDYRSLGTDWQLESISLSDHLYNQVDYYRDGHVAYQGGDPGSSTHSFDLAQADFHLEAGPPGAHDYPEMSWCPDIGVVDLEVLDPYIEYGETVTPEGSVTVGDVPLPDPIVALHEYGEGEPTLVGVVQGNDNGSFHQSLVATEKTDIKATFLGVEGPLSSGVVRSPRTAVVVRPHVDLFIEGSSFRAGQKVKLWGSVSPPQDGTVTVQRRAHGSWRHMREINSSEDESFAFQVRPQQAGRYVYRVVTAPNKAFGQGMSRRRVLHMSPRR